MKILVTGGNGYIGSHTAAYALEGNADNEIVAVDDLRNSKPYVSKFLKNLGSDRYNLYELSTANLNNLPDSVNNISGVIHFAANKSVNESMLDPLLYYNNNIDSLVQVLKYVVKHNIRNFVFSSSCTVYGDVSANPIRETDKPGEIKSVYGYTKVVCEKILEDFHRAYPSTNIVILRYFNPIGSHESCSIGDDPVGKMESLMPLICRYVINWPKYKFILHGSDYNTIDGSCIRDFININDLARAHIMCLEWLKNQSGVYEIFNVGTGQGVSVRQILDTFKKTNNSTNLIFTPQDHQFIVGPRRSGDVEQIWADTSKIERVLGYRTIYTLEQSCGSAYGAFLKIS